MMKRLLLLLLCLFPLTPISTSEAAPRSAVYEGLSLQTGDIVFQQISGELGRLVQGVTESELDHCGIIAVNPDGSIDVIEAITRVQRTPIEEWVNRGQKRRILVLRPTEELSRKAELVISSAETFLGRPYDILFKMDDESLYCSELVWKAYLRGTGVMLQTPEALTDYRFMPYLPQILWITRGESPFERDFITPVGLSQSPYLQEISNDFGRETSKHRW